MQGDPSDVIQPEKDSEKRKIQSVDPLLRNHAIALSPFLNDQSFLLQIHHTLGIIQLNVTNRNMYSVGSV